MKGVIIATLLALLLAAPFAYGVDAELRNFRGSCDSAGNALISMLHNGGPLKTTDINVTAVFIRTNSSAAVMGIWKQELSSNPLYITGDLSKVFLNTTNRPFMKKGPYDVHFIFFQKSSDLLPTDITIGIDCPGSPCSSDADCSYDSSCTNNVCTALRCSEGEFIEQHSCISKCNDYNPCTIDIYENGTCSYERKTGACCRNDNDCNTGRACFTDKCVNSVCTSTPVVCEAANDKCVISSCVEPKGCVYDTDASCLADENVKREYLIVVGEPSVQRQPFWSGIFNAIGNFFRNLF